MPLPVALSLVDVTVRYGDRVALERVSLDVRRGEIVGLLGPNGSGKSSTLAVAAGVLDPASGAVTIDGRSRTADPSAFARRVGLVPQEPAVYDELTAFDNLTFFGELYGLAGPAGQTTTGSMSVARDMQAVYDTDQIPYDTTLLVEM